MLILIFILSGCTENSFVNFMESENGIIDEISEGNSDSWMKLEAENIVSQDKAILIANNHFLSMNEVSSQKKPASKSKTVEKITAIKDEKFDYPLIYVLEYEEDGFCLVSGDTRFDPILAYSETNNWGGEELNGPNVFLNIYKEEIRKVKLKESETNNEIKSEWNRLNLFVPGRSAKRSDNGEGSRTNGCTYGECLPIYCESYSFTQVGPLIHPIAQWRQGGSFNYYGPSDSKCECSRKNAGCGPVALAMLLRYHEYPLMNMSYNGDSAYTNYTDMPIMAGICSNNSGGYKSSSMLIALCGSAMNSDYGVLGTCNTSTHPDKIGNGLNWFGYSHDGKGNLSDRYNAINSDLSNGYPVIMSGSESLLWPFTSWHIWIADGRKYVYSESWLDNHTCDDIWNGAYPPIDCGVCPSCVNCYIYYSTEWHMNWGWGGLSNGWYLASSSVIDKYKHYMRAYTNIRPQN